MDDHPNPSRIALLVHHRPPWARAAGAEAIWCESASEVAVLARARRVRAVVLDALFADLDPELVTLVRRSCTVVVVDGRARTASRWAALGATVVPTLPSDEPALLDAVGAAEAARREGSPVPASRPDRGALIAVFDAPGSDGVATATSVSRSLVVTGTGTGPVVLADLTLDAPHRSLHGLTTDRAGLPELIEAGRFGPPPYSPIQGRHPATDGYLVVPGLVRHQDWVTVGDHAAEAALEAIRAGADVVVAHVDRDLEGEVDTGSFDIEDRNVLTRTAVRAADLVVVAAGPDRSGRLGVIAALSALARFGAPHERTVVVRPSRRRQRGAARHATSEQVLPLRRGGRPDARLGTALRERLTAFGPRDEPRPSGHGSPERIVPGTLGHWGHDVEGWITPRVPQQP